MSGSKSDSDQAESSESEAAGWLCDCMEVESRRSMMAGGRGMRAVGSWVRRSSCEMS